jgi:hypothetical protein
MKQLRSQGRLRSVRTSQERQISLLLQDTPSSHSPAFLLLQRVALQQSPSAGKGWHNASAEPANQPQNLSCLLYQLTLHFSASGMWQPAILIICFHFDHLSLALRRPGTNDTTGGRCSLLEKVHVLARTAILPVSSPIAVVEIHMKFILRRMFELIPVVHV